jgi:uncharacterized Zn finger protein (UPF0148 family)
MQEGDAFCATCGATPVKAEPKVSMEEFQAQKNAVRKSEIAELEKAEHPLHKIYMEVKPYITGACEYCTAGFKQGLHVKEAGIPLISEYKKHPSVRRLIMEGYSVITI